MKKFLPRELDVARKLGTAFHWLTCWSSSATTSGASLSPTSGKKPLKDHRNVIKTLLIHDVRSSDNIYIISELARTDLLEYMKLKGALRETLVRRLFYDLASGVHYMHSINLVHRDIKW